jgi:hypothetical protein
MTPTLTAGPKRRGLGFLAIATVAVITLASGTVAQSPAPAASPATGVGVPQASAATQLGQRTDICPRVREQGGWGFGRGAWRGRVPVRPGEWRGRVPVRQGERRDRVRLRQGERRDRVRLRQRDRREWRADRSGRRRTIAVPRVLAAAARIVTISAIEGTMLTLMTPDGWSRTVDTAAIRIMRGGQTITVADLRVGQQVRVRQRRADDGTWQVTRIAALLTTVRGTVASVTEDGFVLTTRDGGSRLVRLSETTRWLLVCGSSADAALEVGTRVVARGSLAADGSLEATAVAAAGPHERRVLRDQELPGPVATPAPAASPVA